MYTICNNVLVCKYVVLQYKICEQYIGIYCNTLLLYLLYYYTFTHMLWSRINTIQYYVCMSNM